MFNCILYYCCCFTKTNEKITNEKLTNEKFKSQRERRINPL